VIERAIAKSARIVHAEGVRPDPEPAPQQEPAVRRLEIDSAMLARAGIFTPESTVNRTTEEFRLIKRAVLGRADQARADGVANADLVMVTSTREGEGKTFVALNLAFSLAAEHGRSVMLIDADPAKSSVAQYLGLEVEHGLTDLLRDGGTSLSDVVIPTSIRGLSIVPAGERDPLSAELFASDRMGALLQTFCRTSPDSIVILDAPPVLATSEPSSRARLSTRPMCGQIAIRFSASVIAARLVRSASTTSTVYKTYYRRGRGYPAGRS
jgi:protein-tyrosine kinase